MKVLVQRSPISTADPYVQQDLKEYLRIDFMDDDSAVANIGNTAASEIEQFAQIALLTQTITVTIFDPVLGAGFSLPIGPATDRPTITVDGSALTAFDFVGGNRPYVRWHDECRSLAPDNLTIEYQAGFGDGAADIPSDIAQALMDQAALHYDGRSPMDRKSLTTSPHMARIAARYRGVQA